MGLSLKETERVLDFVRAITRQGKSAIFIDHNIFHVYDVADRFAILDRGRLVAQFDKSALSRDALIQKMIQLHDQGTLQ